MHNGGKRVTVLFRGRGAWTFNLKQKKSLKRDAKWDGKLRGKQIYCGIRFEIKPNPKDGRRPYFRIKGGGTDDNKDFVIDSRDVPFDPQEFFGNWEHSMVEKDGKGQDVKFSSFDLSTETMEITGQGADPKLGGFTITNGELIKYPDKREYMKVKFDKEYDDSERGSVRQSFSGTVDTFRGLMEGKYVHYVDGEPTNDGFFTIM